MRNLRRAVTAFAAVALVALLTIGPAGAKTASPPCGLVVTTNTTLTHNYDFSGGKGICVESDNVKLNLGGHTVQGGSGSFGWDGILVEGNNVQVTNGTVANFDYDVYVDDVSNVTVSNLKLVTDGDWDYYGLYVYKGVGLTISRVSCVDSYSCIGLDGSDFGDGVSNSTVTKNSDNGSEYAFWDDYGTSNVFSKNTSTGSEYGFYTYETATDTFSRNTVKHAGYVGFYDDENSMGILYSDNQALDGDYGWVLYGNDDDDDNPQGGWTLQRNTASGNESDGFSTEYGFYYGCGCPSDPGSSFIQNTATNNGGNGFYDYWSINSTWSGNTATKNGANGFWFQYPQNDVITGNTARSNTETGMWLEYNDPGSGYNAQTFANNNAKLNSGDGLYADFPQTGTGNVAKKNSPIDCWNVSCQAGATFAVAPDRPVLTGAPVKRPHAGARPQAHHS